MKGKLIPLVADVTSKEDLERIAAQVEKEQGYISLLSIIPQSQTYIKLRIQALGDHA